MSRSSEPDPHRPQGGVSPRLDSLRDRMGQVDLDLIAKAAERVELARQVGELKRQQDLPTVDYTQERLVMERARVAAQARGLRPEVAEELLSGLIRASVRAQDDDGLRFAGVGTGQTAVVVGGAGRMGRWLSSFLSAQGFTIRVLDPLARTATNESAARSLPEAELVVCSTPPAATAHLYTEWRTKPPAGVIVDIASIKTPLVGPIARLQQSGARVASIHPLFGPSTFLLRDADVVICDTGDEKAGAVVESLFQPTTAHIVHLPLGDHDRIMADLLSLAHATAIAFALALPETGHPVRSTTFRLLESLAASTVRESPEVYYEIQASNPHSAQALERLRAALDRLVETVTSQDPQQFRSLFEEGRRRTPGG